MAVDFSDDKRKIRLHIEMKQSRDEACLRVTRLPKAGVSNRDQKLSGIGRSEEEFCKNPCESASKSCFETIIQQDGNCPLTVGMKYMPDAHKALIPQVEFDVRKSEDECETSRDGQKRVQDNNGRSAASKTEAIEEKRSVLALRRMMDDGKVDAGFQDGKQAPSAGLDHYANNSDRAPAVSTSPRMPPSSPPQLQYRSPPNCTETCSGVKKPSPATPVLGPEATLLRRNGLDDDTSRKFRKSFGKPSRVCPVRCCTPPRAPPQRSKSPAQSKSQSSSIPREGKEPAAAATSEARSRNSGRLFREQPSKSVRDCAETRKISLPDCEELATRYRDYFTEVQLEKYQERSSKRNGLQDEYCLPVPRAVLELRREELRQKEVANSDSSKLEKSSVKSQARKSLKSETSSVSQKRKARLKRVKSKELRGGVLYLDCNCHHRNGLQEDCPRRSCGGIKAHSCSAKPLPKCDLGAYFLDKLEKYYEKLDDVMPTAFCGSSEDWKRIRRKRSVKDSKKELQAEAHKNESKSKKPPNSPKVEKKGLQDKVKGTKSATRTTKSTKQYILVPL